MNLKSFFFFLLITTATFSIAQEPALVVYNFDGDEVALNTLTQQNKNKVIIFWATYCYACKIELEAFERLAPKWKKKFNTEISIIALDGPNKVIQINKLLQEKGWLDYSPYVDNGMEAYRGLKGQSIPMTLVFDSQGYLIKRFDGYDYGMENKIHNILFKLNKAL